MKTAYKGSGEPGVGGVSVNLYEGGTSSLIDTTATDASGFFMFTGLDPDNYFLEFILPVAFDGFTAANQGGDDAKDSDADQVDGRTNIFILSSGDLNDTLDAGLIRDSQQIPEPTTLALLGLGLGGISLRRKKTA